MTEEKSCGAVILHEDKFLVVKKRQEDGGHWDFPKGKIQAKETEQECAKREVYEETGLKIRMLPGFKAEIQYYPKAGVLKTVVFFLAFPEQAKVKYITGEITDHKWLPYEQALKQLTYENARSVLRKAKEFLEEN